MYINHWGEKIIVRKSSGNRFLDVVQAGITYPNPQYRIAHNISKECTYEYYVFEYVVSGTGYIETPEGVYTVKQGDLYFLNKLCRHIYYPDQNDPYEKIFVVLKGSYIDSLLLSYRVTDSVFIRNFKCDRFMQDFLALLDGSGVMDFDSIAIKVLQMFQILFPSPHEIDRSTNHTAELIKNYIDNHISEKITLDDISKNLFISKSHIERAFKDAYLMSPLAYHAVQKVNQVASMLQTTNYTPTQIAQMLNYSNVKYMSKCFKKVKGMSPIEYRKHKYTIKNQSNKGPSQL